MPGQSKKSKKPQKGMQMQYAGDMPSDDDIDKFNDQVDYIAFDSSKSKNQEPLLDQKHVLDIDSDVSTDEEDLTSESKTSAEELPDDDEQLIQEAIQSGGKNAQYALVAKELRKQLKKQEGVRHVAGDVDDDVEGTWGAKQREYYAEEEEESGSDSEAADLVEEAKRQQAEEAAYISLADLALGPQPAKTEGPKGVELGADDVDSEEHEADDDNEEEVRNVVLTPEQRRDAVLQDAPELQALLADMRASLAAARHLVGPLLEEAKAGSMLTRDGLSFLEVKHLLLLSYSIHVLLFVLLKCEGKSVRGHPVIQRLLEIRTYLEKLRPLDKKLQPQVQKLLEATKLAHSAGDGANASALAHAPNPDQLMVDDDEADEQLADGERGLEGGVYRPPKLHPVALPQELEVDAPGLERQKARERKQLRMKSELVAELEAELAGRPVEERLDVAMPDSKAAIRAKKRLAAHQEMEEMLMARIPMSKKERKALKADLREQHRVGGTIDHFADDVAGILGVAASSQLPKQQDAMLTKFTERHAASQKFGAKVAGAGGAGHTGDEDLPLKESLADRRAQMDNIRSKQLAKRMREDAAGDGDEDGYEDYDVEPGRKARRKLAAAEGFEDEFYQSIASAQKAKQQDKQQRYAPDTPQPPRPDRQTLQARNITREIQDNRGLTRSRPRGKKNPRKNMRDKFSKALVRQGGKVQRVKPTGQYGGEASGIRSKVVKSRKMS